MNPTGGLARRKTKLAEQKDPLVVDSGNALFALPGKATPEETARAKFVLTTMAKLGTQVMAVGQRDLNAGVAFLKETSAGTGLKLLSANLKADGKLAFERGVVINHHGVKVGFVGATVEGPEAGPALPAVKEAIAALGSRDVTIVLAAIPYQEAMTLAEGLKGLADLVIQSHEGRGSMPAQTMSSGVMLMASGRKGQSLGVSQLVLAGKGQLTDLSEAGRNKQQAEFVQRQLDNLKERVKLTTDPAAKAQLISTIKELTARKAEADIKARAVASSRTISTEYFTLDSSVTDDPELKAEVLKIDPAYSGSH